MSEALRLTKEQRKMLREGVIGAYPNPNDLKILLSDQMDVQLGAIARGDAYNDRVFSLIQDFEAEGRIEEFIRVVVDDNPNSPFLSAIIKEFAGISGENPTDCTQLTPSQTAGKGLFALKDLMSNLEIYAEVKAGKDKLQEAWNQIKIISTYKSVHDELHDLELLCYQPIIDQEPGFSEDTKRSLRELRVYYSTLRRINDKLDQITKIKIENQPILQEADWLQDLKQAQEQLSEFIEISSEIADFCKLQPTIRLLNYVLAQQPTVMDANLHSTAKALSLPNLVQSMSNIRKNITQVQPISEQESKKIRHFQEEMKALEDLQEKYDSLITRHHEWQGIELDLRLIQSDLTHNINDLAWSLPRLKTKIEKQYSDVGEEWMKEIKKLKKCEDKLNNTLAIEVDTSKVKDDFLAWRQQAGVCFFVLDKELNSFCEQLRDYIEKPLASIASIALIIEMMAL